jgi:hypothetical protein
MTIERRSKIFDVDLLLKTAGALTASGAAGSILDLGPGYTEADLVVDVAAVEVDTGDEIYTVKLQASDQADFSANVTTLVAFTLGNPEADEDTVVNGAGRYVVPFSSQKCETVYPYVRLYVAVAGAAVATGVDFLAFLSNR